MSCKEAEIELERLFGNIRPADHHLCHNIKRSKSLVCKYKKRGLTYFPTNSPKDFELHGKPVSIHNFRLLLKEMYPKLDAFWLHYENAIASRLNVDRSVIERDGTLVLLRYADKTGLWMHVDNLCRSDGPAFTIGLGRSAVYDLAPCLQYKYDKETPSAMLRCAFSNGSIAVISGKARYQWSHGVPYGAEGVKYTIILKLNHNPDRPYDKYIGTESTLGCPMYDII